MSFKVRNNRNKSWFWVDNEIIDHYAGEVGSSATLVYMALCRLANNDTQRCYPSIRWLAKHLDLSKTTVVTSINKLVKAELIHKESKKGSVTNYYILTVLKNGTPNRVYQSNKGLYQNKERTVPKSGTDKDLSKKTHKKRLTPKIVKDNQGHEYVETDSNGNPILL